MYLQLTSDGKREELEAEGKIRGNMLILDEKLREARNDLTPIEIDDL